MFGDKDKYFNKLKALYTLSQQNDTQVQSESFYCKEHTKPLFNAHGIMTVHNLYNYHCFMEIFKILKFRTPISLFSKFQLSQRKQTLILTPVPCTDFIYKSSVIWNSLRNSLGINDFSINISLIRSKLKALILSKQHSLSEIDWLTENFEI